MTDFELPITTAFDAVFTGADIRIIRTPVRAPNANAHVERWIGSVRRECLDRLLIVGRRHLEHVLRIYVRHHNQARPHRALDLQRLLGQVDQAVRAHRGRHEAADDATMVALRFASDAGSAARA